MSAPADRSRLRALLSLAFARTASLDARVDRLAAARLGPLPLPLVFVALVLLANLALNLVSDIAPGYDDREQLADMAAWAWGYRGVQPPLHTWLIKLVDLAVGSDIAAIYVTRSAVLCVIAVLLYRIGRELQLSRQGAGAAALGLFLMPTVGWEAQRSFSHSLSGMLFTALFQLAVLMLLRRRSTGTYALTGASAALALLGKYNSLIGLAGAACAIVLLPEVRKRLRAGGMLVAAAVGAAILAAPLTWLAAGRLETLDDSAGKFGFHGSGSFLLDRLEGAGEFALNTLSYCGPLIVLALIAGLVACIDGRIVRGSLARLGVGTRYLLTAIAASFLLAFALILVSGTTEVKGYWLHPILITLPAAAAAILEAVDATGWANRFLIFCAIILALASVVAFVLRAYGIGM
ncbi:glycosyltransferase family 39 protein [Aurantimonas sp. 22II-16-19i]|uniref:ArnT family glycosyltransferase n=1 Tax=Aurantimonas sp. 22II-16-19i TaxID=1317114 RepID=UPI0009F7B3A0|nr:glycosyltransferase family 39 protein [Aurantimonas sp. 22II-16-19i]ORE97188.1 glycosyl transferase family protein [Aurantimonas sp. 22II-16-19i]